VPPLAILETTIQCEEQLDILHDVLTVSYKDEPEGSDTYTDTDIDIDAIVEHAGSEETGNVGDEMDVSDHVTNVKNLSSDDAGKGCRVFERGAYDLLR
jgi:hypothetical protein